MSSTIRMPSSSSPTPSSRTSSPRSAKDTPKVRETLIFDGPPVGGQKRVEPLLAAHTATPLELDGPPLEPMTMIYTSGTTGKPKGAVRSSLGNPAQSAALWGEIGYVARRRLHHDRPALSLGPGRLPHHGPSPGQHRRAAAQIRRRRLAAPRPNLSCHHNLRRPHADPPHLPTARRRSSSATTSPRWRAWWRTRRRGRSR